ncbi:hypothetical protein X777_01562 [Ooceraea biroi]|uniref:Uncharacterized protein n=1 Tax=Ooceraea biroi TaxID=2015173 RepID=A0A026WQI5_OOCBI|nr:hypothetical protein X777_01562 [Ooceraea biroi]
MNERSGEPNGGRNGQRRTRTRALADSVFTRVRARRHTLSLNVCTDTLMHFVQLDDHGNE